jgi:hypothetical protein
LAPNHWRWGMSSATEGPFPMAGESNMRSSIYAIDTMWNYTEWSTTRNLNYFSSVDELLAMLNDTTSLLIPDLADQRRESTSWWKRTMRNYIVNP